MADLHDHVSLELIDAGDHKDLIVQVLSKVKGLSMSPEQIVNSAPCTIAVNVPRGVAEKLRGFLEKAGAMVMLESEEDLFSPDELPASEEQQETAEPSEEFPASAEDGLLSAEPSPLSEDDLQFEAASPPPEDDLQFEVASPSSEDDLQFEEPSPQSEDDLQFTAPSTSPEGDLLAEALPSKESPSEEFGGFQAVSVGAAPEFEGEEEEFEDEEEFEEEEKEPGTFQKIFSRLQELKDKKKAGDTKAKAKPEKEKKKFSFPSIPKLRKPKAEKPAEPYEKPGQIRTADEEEGEPKEKKIPDLILKYLVPGVIGFLVGAIIMGAWGWSSIRSTQQATDQELSEYQQSKESSAELRAKTQQQEQEIAQLKQQNTGLTQQNSELNGQIDTLKTQLDEARAPKSIIPSAMPVSGALTPDQEAIVTAFQQVKDIHAQSLENGYTAQKNASCSRQLLLDGKSTMTYAQVVKKFTATITTFDIMRSDSLITPYIAEFKIPFQQERRTGNSEKACNSVSLQSLPTPAHYEFGSFYGYWTIQYVYQDGKWRVKSTVIEKNRALYDSAFKLGSPDYAKFLIDTKLFPEFKN